MKPCVENNFVQNSGAMKDKAATAASSKSPMWSGFESSDFDIGQPPFLDQQFLACSTGQGDSPTIAAWFPTVPGGLLRAVPFLSRRSDKGQFVRSSLTLGRA